MRLPSDLIYKFAKLYKPEKKSKETRTYGTVVKDNDRMYVKLDGADDATLTPVESTVSYAENDRVSVLIKDHRATIIGNVTSPAIGTAEKEDIDNDISDINDTAVSEITTWYYASISPLTTVGGMWTTSSPEWTDGVYIWTKTVSSSLSGGTIESSPVCITGNTGSGEPGPQGPQGPKGEDGQNGQNGQDGEDGEDGISIVSVTQQYYSHTSRETLPTNPEWIVTPPPFEPGKFIWTRSYITYSDGSTSATTPYYDSHLQYLYDEIIKNNASLEDRLKAAENGISQSSTRVQSLIDGLFGGTYADQDSNGFNLGMYSIGNNTRQLLSSVSVTNDEGSPIVTLSKKDSTLSLQLTNELMRILDKNDVLVNINSDYTKISNGLVIEKLGLLSLKSASIANLNLKELYFGRVEV